MAQKNKRKQKRLPSLPSPKEAQKATGTTEELVTPPEEVTPPENSDQNGGNDNKSSHEAILEAYQRQQAYDLGEGYAAYLKANGSATLDSYREAVQAAELAYARDREGYGARGERVASLGLNDSGYSAYLATAREREREAAIHEARKEYDAASRLDEKGYAAYLKGRNQTTMSLFKHLTASGITDYETAYDYARSMGASSAHAEMIATLAGEWGDKALVSSSEGIMRLRVIDSIIDLELPPDAAYSYALACGLNESVAKELADVATEALEKRYNYKDIIYFS